MQANDSMIELATTSTMAGQFKTAIKVRNFHEFHMDEPENIGGTDSAPNPMEYVLASLCGCESVMFNLIAQEMNLQIDDLKISATGTLDMDGLKGKEGVRPYFNSVSQTLELTFLNKEGITEERVQELIEKVTARCPAYNLLKEADVKMKVETTIK